MERFWGWVRRVMGWTGGDTGKAVARRTYFDGAQVNRLTSSWFASLQSANNEVEADIRKLRARSRELFRNNAQVAALAHLLRVNVGGPTGIALQSQYLTTRNTPHKGNRALELAFDAWGMPEHATRDGRMGWAELMQSVPVLMAQDGEILIRRIRGPGARNPYGYTLQLIDPDQLDDQLNTKPDAAGMRIRMGIELDDADRPLAYHLWEHHPADAARYRAAENRRVRVPAAEIIHDFLPHRPGAVRGVPWIAPVMLLLEQVDKWREAAVMAARAGASKMGFFVDRREEAGDSFVAPPEVGAGASGGRLSLEIEPGLMSQLPPGLEFQGFDPGYPNVGYEAFERAVLRSIASALGLSYTSLASDLTAVNYSSLRGGLITERDVYRLLQQRLIRHLCRPIYRDWLQEATLTSAIRPPVYDFDQLASSATWSPRGWAWVDPLKDVQAIKEQLALGLTSRTQEMNALGRDFADTIEQLTLEQALADEAGVNVMGLTSQGDTKGSDTGGDDGDTEQAGTGDAGSGDDAPADRHRHPRLIRRLG